MLKGQKENFRWSSVSALKKDQVHIEYHIMGVKKVRRGRGLFLHLSLRYYKCFLLPCGLGRSGDTLSQAVSVVPALLVPGEPGEFCLVSASATSYPSCIAVSFPALFF